MIENDVKKIEFIYETSWIEKEMVALYNSKDKSERYVKEQINLYPDLGYDSCNILIIPKETFENIFRGMI